MSQNLRGWAYPLPLVVLLMAPFDVLASLGMDIYLPIVPLMPEELGTTPNVVQLTLTIYMLTLGFGQVIFGPISDRVGRRPVLLGGALVFASASFLLATSSSGAMFLLLRFLQALGASAAMVATFATVRDLYGERPESVTIYALFSSILAFVPALGPITGAVVSEALGWRAIFIALGLLALLACVHAVFRWAESRPIAASNNRRGYARMLRSRSFVAYTLGFSAAMGCFFVFFSTAPRVLIHRAGYSEIEFSLAFATVAVAMIVTARFAPRFVTGWGEAGSLRRGMVVLLASAALLLAGEVYLEPSFLSYVVPMWAAAVGIVFAVSVTANGALREFGEQAGAAVALYFFVQSLITSLVGTLVVLIFDGDTALPISAFILLMSPAVLLAINWAHKDGR